MFQALTQRIAYERTFSLAERWERAKEKAARFAAWHLLPENVEDRIATQAKAKAMSDKCSVPEDDEVTT